MQFSLLTWFSSCWKAWQNHWLESKPNKFKLVISNLSTQIFRRTWKSWFLDSWWYSWGWETLSSVLTKVRILSEVPFYFSIAAPLTFINEIGNFKINKNCCHNSWVGGSLISRPRTLGTGPGLSVSMVVCLILITAKHEWVTEWTF